MGGADHSARFGAGDHSPPLPPFLTATGGGLLLGHSARFGGGEDHSAVRCCCPLAAAMRRLAAGGRKLDREGLSVRKLSVASSDLKIEIINQQNVPHKNTANIGLNLG